MQTFCTIALLFASLGGAASEVAPKLQWVRTVAESADTSVAAGAADSDGNFYLAGSAKSDAFLVKLDRDGNTVYTTSFGGSGVEKAAALAVGADGSAYLSGSTTSSDLPTTPGGYRASMTLTQGRLAGFLVKFNPSGSIEWATYFPESNIGAAAVDRNGNPFIAGYTAGGLPTTPGVYVADFQQTVGSNGFFSVFGPTAAFVTKFNPSGSDLLYSTYVPSDAAKNTAQSARALTVDSQGNAWIGIGIVSTIAVPVGTPPSVIKLNASGTAVLGSAVQPGLGNVTGLALDGDSNVYVAGNVMNGTADVFVAKWNSGLDRLLASTVLGGEGVDRVNSIAIDPAGGVIVGGEAESKGLPTRAPFQLSFSSSSGYVAGFDPDLSTLRFSTYLGDDRPFSVRAVVADGMGNLSIGGATIVGAARQAFANRIELRAAPPLRLDGIYNYASRLGQTAAPGEALLLTGAGFGPGMRLEVDGVPVDILSVSPTSLVAVLPESLSAEGARSFQLSNSSGAVSNPVLVPAGAAAPGIYAADESGAGEAYVLNADGTLNSAANPAAEGSVITLFATGVGRYRLSDGYAVTEQTPDVFVDAVYARGVSAVIGPEPGRPGLTYRLSVYVPKLSGQRRSDRAPLQLRMRTAGGSLTNLSQPGVFLYVR